MDQGRLDDGLTRLFQEHHGYVIQGSAWLKRIGVKLVGHGVKACPFTPGGHWLLVDLVGAGLPAGLRSRLCLARGSTIPPSPLLSHFVTKSLCY